MSKEKKLTFYQALTSGDAAEVQKYIAQGIDLEKTVAHSDSTPLEIAVSFGHTEIVNILLKLGVSTNYGDNCSLLENASNEKTGEILRLLIDAGIEVNTRFVDDNETALICIAGMGKLQSVKALVEAGAEVNAVSKQGNSALFNAAWAGYPEVYDYLYPLTASELRGEAEEVLKTGVTRRQRLEDEVLQKFLEAASVGDLEALYLSIQKGVNINAFDEDGESALVRASRNINYSIVKALIKVGADVDLGTEIDGETPLITASGFICVRNPQVSAARSFQLQFEVIDSLIQAGANVNATNYNGWTALMQSVTSNTLQIAERLIGAGANINMKSKMGDTALSLAQRHNNNEMLELLLSTG